MFESLLNLFPTYLLKGVVGAMVLSSTFGTRPVLHTLKRAVDFSPQTAATVSIGTSVSLVTSLPRDHLTRFQEGQNPPLPPCIMLSTIPQNDLYARLQLFPWRDSDLALNVELRTPTYQFQRPGLYVGISYKVFEHRFGHSPLSKKRTSLGVVNRFQYGPKFGLNDTFQSAELDFQLGKTGDIRKSGDIDYITQTGQKIGNRNPSSLKMMTRPTNLSLRSLK